MPLPWEIITEHLRTELQSYGGLLQLFIEQQDNLMRRDADTVLVMAEQIEAAARVTDAARRQREQVVSHCATAHGLPPDITLRQLVPHFPKDVQPLLGALIDEINRLIHRVRQGARRSHELLSRTVELHQDTLRALRPAAFVKTYSPQGQVSVASGDHGWQAAG